MITYSISKINKPNIGVISSVLATLSLSEDAHLEIEVFSIGAGLRRISYVDEANHIDRLITLSYDDIFESCHNTSLAGLTIGPNAGRLVANQDITLSDNDLSLTVNLPANEDGTKQIHGGTHKISDKIWDFDGVERYEDESIAITFSCAQEDGLDNWPGNRKYMVTYLISNDGTLKISFNGTSDKCTYINMTNHTYWLRNGLKLQLNATSYIKNRDDFLPEEIISMENTCYSVNSSDVLNNAFLINSGEDAAATMSYADIPLQIELSTDAPAIVCYTGDYLDNSTLFDNSSSSKACAIALEPQELYPCTTTTLTTDTKPFTRNISYHFSIS